MIEDISPDAVDAGFKLLYEFSLVQGEANLDELQEAFTLLLLSLGVDEDAKDRIYEHVAEYVHGSSVMNFDPFATGLIVIGLIIGLGIAQNAAP